jgi:hypothetical protein
VIAADEIQEVNPRLWLWQAYDAQVKSDLFATAVLDADGLTLIDPIPLTPSSLADLTDRGTIRRILVTNSNHLRAAPDFAVDLAVPIFWAQPVGEKIAGADSILIDSGRQIASNITPLAIDGAASGETAFHFKGDGGTIVLGDALLHLEPYGFALLPAKYCSDQEAMRRSLRQLLDWPFERLLFAHGRPILSAARMRLEALLR